MDEAAYDLLVLTDATASMGSYLSALNRALPEIIHLSAMTGCFSRIGVLAYRDYCKEIKQLTAWSGWYLPVDTAKYKNDAAAGFSHSGLKTISQATLLEFARKMRTEGGYDWPEATKTGLAHAYEVMGEHSKTLILLFADAPPHLAGAEDRNTKAERDALTKKGRPGGSYPYGGHGNLFADWVSAVNALRGPKKAQVFPIIRKKSRWYDDNYETIGPYTLLARNTGGTCFEIDNSHGEEQISALVVEVLLTWMNVKKEGSEPSRYAVAEACEFKDESDIEQLTSETDELAKKYIGSNAEDNRIRTLVNSSDFHKHIQVREPPMADFSKHYAADPGYRGLVVTHIKTIIETNVTALTINPVFGSLWRAVCNDRHNEFTDGLAAAFGAQVEKIQDPEKKSRMKNWLAESYNYAADNLAVIEEVAAEDQYPCVFLDPTEVYSVNTGDDEPEQTKSTPKNGLSRDELLEIGRSCDHRVLRRLGRVLTRLTYVTSAEDLPAHIKDVSQEDVPRVPLALAEEKYKRKFWKILLHAILPGTRLAARPAALLAALSLRMGIQPLQDVADAELLHWADLAGWNNEMEYPETWNTNCLALVLDADAHYEKRVKDGVTQRPSADAKFIPDADRILFETLVNYKLLEMNLDTAVEAKVGWQPSQTMAPLGPLVVCKVCHFPRSVTIMAPGGVCGCCDRGACDCPNTEEHEERVKKNVAESDTESTEARWVECSMTECRAQYVVYNVDKLRVRPKCHYCRGQRPTAPCVECTGCLSRIVWPDEYRPTDLDLASYRCPACVSGRQTIVGVSTTARELSQDNGWDWILRNDDNKIAKPFSGRSLYHVAYTYVNYDFTVKVEVLPVRPDPPVLQIKGKLVRNPDGIIASLRKWVLSRRAEAGECSLCFSNFKKRDIRPACGRSGCTSKICNGCLADWYGLNKRGKILNVAALSCPFCRRRPAPQTVSPFGLNGLGDLRLAVEEAGSWIYAWCNNCGFAKRYVERVCAAGAPAEVTDWRCEECKIKAQGPAASGLVIKNCPGCDTPTEKMAGCDHMMCVVRGCGAHWCFFCSKKVDETEIYQHMSREHGGWYDGREYEGGYELDDDYDEDE